MMINTQTLARPYAKAAFEFAKEAGETTEWFTMLELAACAIEQPVVVQELGKPTLTRDKKADLLANLLEDNTNKVFMNFLHVLSEHDRLPLLPAICDLYKRYKLEAERVVDVEVETAYELDTEQLQKITAALSKRLERTVNTKQIINAALIGGLIIRADDLVIDNSVRGRLNKLTEIMNS